MLFHETSFIGVDPTASGKLMTYAAINHNMRLIALGKGTLEEVLAFVSGQKSAFVGVNAPSKPNQGLMQQEEIRNTMVPAPKPGRWHGFRVAEYQLNSHNIHTTRTPAKEENCQNWIKIGFQFYERLNQTGYSKFEEGDSGHQYIEVYPHASYCVLLDRIPYAKKDIEGRLQRQLILHSKGMEIRDPMILIESITRYKILNGAMELDLLYSVEELDALVAAYTAWMTATRPEMTTTLGHPDEGEIILPAPFMLKKYS